MKVEKIDINLIIRDESQPRKTFDEQQIKELAYSIQKYGLLQPILVKKVSDKYQLIAGERRYRALKLLKAKTVDAIIKSDDNIMQIALIENIQRENLSPLEEANAIMELKNSQNYTHEELSRLLGKTRVYITNKLRVLSADENTKKLLADDKISEGHARALLGEKNISERKKIAQKILNQGLSVRDTEKAVKNSKEKNNLQEEDYEISEMLEEKLSTKVEVKRQSTEKGSINIEFYSYEQLKDIINEILY